jgi:hypothetical protein
MHGIKFRNLFGTVHMGKGPGNILSILEEQQIGATARQHGNVHQLVT